MAKKREVRPSKPMSRAKLARARAALAGRAKGGGRATAAAVERTATSIGKGQKRVTPAQMGKAAAAARDYREGRKKK